MDYRAFGKTGFKVSCIGMGTYYDPFWIIVAMLFKTQLRAERIVEALRVGLEAGVNLIDTAEIYRSEALVAKAIEGFKRDELFIASKVWPNHLHYDSVLQACEKSLRRLGTSYLDLYQIHWYNRRVPLKETMRAMEKLVDEGKVRYIGVSNFSLREMFEAEDAMSKHQLTSTQMHYNLTNRVVEQDILPHCETKKIVLLAYYPLAHGKLAGKRFSSTEAYRTITSKHNGKTPAQIALNWLRAKSNVVIPIPRASNPTHVNEDLGAAGWRLDGEDMDQLNKAFPVR